VIETQKSILEFIRIYTYNLQLTGKHSFHSHSTYSFNAGMIDLIAALLNGTGAYVFDRNKNKKEIDNPLRDSFSSKLREYLVEALPDYMIPSYFVQVEKIPMTPNGKVDVKALPAPALGAGNELHPLHKPRNEIEEKLTRIWFELLGIEKDKIGIDSNFFELGGHSLSATVMVTKIHRELNVKLSLGEVFTAPTIRGLAGLAKAGEEDIYSLIQPVEKREYYPLSSAQLRLFLLSQIKTDITSDNVSGVFSIDGSLEVRYIEDVFHQLINRHEVFRTSFETIDLQPVQRIHRAVSFKIMHIESGNVTGPLTSREINHMAKNIIRPFDLSKAPLLRVGLVKLAEQKHLIIYDMHHIISDGTSFPILVNEFVSLYGRGGLPGMRIQYKDFTHWQNNLLKSNVFKKQEEYWLELFSNEIPKLNLPTDYPREALQEFEGDFVNFVLEKDLTERIYEIADEIGATLYMVLLAIYNILLYKYTGQEDIVVGSSAAGRPHADLQNVLGFFVNTLPMRNYPKGEKTFMEFLTEVKSNALKAYENQDYQFDELVRRLGIQRDASRQVLFDTHFTLHKIYVERNPNPDVKIEDLRFERQSFEDKATQFDIIIHANETAEGVNFIVRYSKKLFKKNTMERFSGYYKEIAQTTADNKNIKLKDIKISHHLEAARTNMPEADFVF
jgi:tyrocidine synthetase-3